MGSRNTGVGNTGILMLAHLSRAASQWALLWLFAWNGGAAAAGLYALALGIAAPIFIVLEFGLRNVYVTHRESSPFFTYLRIRVVSGSAATAITMICAHLIGVTDIAIVALIAITKFFDTCIDIAFGSMQKRGKIRTMALAISLNSVATVAVAGLLYVWSSELQLALVGSAVASFLTLIVYVIPVIRVEAGRTNLGGAERAVGKILRSGAPLGLATGATTLLSYAPLYFLALSGTEQEIGVFAVIIYFVTFANLFYNSVQQAVLHTLVEAYANCRAVTAVLAAYRAVLALGGFGVVLGALVWFFGPAFLAEVYGPEFAIDPMVLWPIAVSIALLPIVYATGMILMTYNVYAIQLYIGGLSLAAVAGWGLANMDVFSLWSASIMLLIGVVVRAVLGMTAAVFFALRLTKQEKGENLCTTATVN